MRFRLISVILCLAVMLSCVGGFSFAAAADDEIPLFTPCYEEEELAQTGADGDNGSEETLQVPQIRVVTEEGNGTSLQKADGYVNASISITDTDGSVLSDNVSFKVRGNTTAMTSIQKKAYNFKFEKKKDVLGMGKGKKWALIANAFDPTLLRSFLTFNIAYELGLQYTSEQRFVELWVDGSYRGCYILYEPVQEGKDRVNIDIESNDGKKDFLIEYEAQREEEGVTYFTVENLRFISSEPEEPNEEQLAYITDTMTDIIHTIQSGDEEKIREKIDVDSFSKYYLMNEFVKTFDFDMSSVFFYYKDGRLYAGPAWDYDLSAGNINDKYAYSPRYKAALYPEDTFADQRNIYKYLGKQPWFVDTARAVYNKYYGFFTSIFADGGLLDSLRAEYSDLFARNYASGVWRVSQPWINIQRKPDATYEENFNYLKNWYKQRHEWLSEYFGLPYYLLGDADCDGEVSVIDASLICRKVSLVPVPAIDEKASDVDGDEEITVIDATFVQRFDVKVDTPYGIGERIRITETDADGFILDIY